MSFGDNAKAAVAIDNLLKKVAEVEEPKAIVVTKAEMQQHAVDAARRGALWLDRRHPGWVDKAVDVVLPFPKAKGSSPYFMQVGLMPNRTPEEMRAEMRTETPAENEARLKANQAKLQAEGDDTRYQPLFTLDELMQGAGLIAGTLGIPVPVQENMLARETMVDFGFYGFHVHYATMAFGLPSFTKLTSDQLNATGYCKDDAAKFLAEAWNDELKSRRGK